jgi:hypothetical protein
VSAHWKIHAANKDSGPVFRECSHEVEP